ncbi:chaperone for protein-folding within the ER [Lactifluus subvellereus]|nr:chaperone for protein-folding within the ER [Lactifluus subvellereus]
MLLSSLTFLLLAPISALAQITYDQAHNATPIVGTWTSGSRHVLTGPGFVNPLNLTFVYPQTTGVSYSFTETGFYEVARYRMYGNGSSPNCITGVMNWAHGTYTHNSNGSMTLHPFGDGFQQIQGACFANSDFIEIYNDTELYQSWQIFMDATDGPKLHMFQFDGSPVTPMFHYSQTPLMLPTQQLRNVSSPTKVAKRAITNGTPPIRHVAGIAAVGGLLGSVLLVLA